MTDVLISVRPHYVDQILIGTKTVELRNRPVRIRPGARLWIYSTLPIGKVVAHTVVQSVTYSSPSTIWSRYRDRLCISRDNFDRYVEGRHQVSAIALGAPHRLRDDIDLQQLRTLVDSFHPPQSYMRLESRSLIAEFEARCRFVQPSVLSSAVA